jgi:hypothetical protein
MLQEDSTSTEEAGSLRHSLAQMYADRAFAPLWYSAGHPTSQAGALTLELNRARFVSDRQVSQCCLCPERRRQPPKHLAPPCPAQPAVTRASLIAGTVPESRRSIATGTA